MISQGKVVEYASVVLDRLCEIENDQLTDIIAKVIEVNEPQIDEDSDEALDLSDAIHEEIFRRCSM